MPDSSFITEIPWIQKGQRFLSIFLDVFLPNLFPAASGLPLSDFSLLYFSREPEELFLPLPEAVSDLFSM